MADPIYIGGCVLNRKPHQKNIMLLFKAQTLEKEGQTPIRAQIRYSPDDDGRQTWQVSRLIWYRLLVTVSNAPGGLLKTLADKVGF